MNEITGKTSTGFEYSYDKRILTDWDYISLIRKVMGENIPNSEQLDATQKIFILLLGEEQTELLVKHIRELNDGYAPMEAIVPEFMEMIKPKN